MASIARRLRHLRAVEVLGREVPVASTRYARLLGLAYLQVEEAGPGLLIRGCRSIHTFGMRFALDLVFLDREGHPCSVRRGVPPRRVAWNRRASDVLELPANSGLLPLSPRMNGGEFSSRRS